MIHWRQLLNISIAVQTFAAFTITVQGFFPTSPIVPTSTTSTTTRISANRRITRLHVSANLDSSMASADSMMKGGRGGRIEDAFRASKSKGEAAFITFVTAGYPTANGTNKLNEISGYPPGSLVLVDVL